MTITIAQTAGQLNNVEYAHDYHCQEILQFFRKYPYTRFSRLAVAHALNNGNAFIIEKALEQLVDDGQVNMQSRNNVNFYTLNDKKQQDG